MIVKDGNAGLENRAKYFVEQGIDIKDVVATRLCHGTKIVRVTQSERGKIISETDGLITNEKNVCLTVTVADCVPVIFWDETKEVIGIAHAGWRGVVAKISQAMVKKFKSEFDSNSEDIKVFIGPHIQKCHFEIQSDILDNFKDYSEQIVQKDNKIFVDLIEILRHQLETSGVSSRNLEISPECTYCNHEYFSFRRDKPEEVQSQVAWIINQ